MTSADSIDIVVIDRKRWQQTEKSKLMWLMTSKIPSLLSGGFYRMLNLWQWFLCPQITITHLRPSAQPDSTHQSSLIFCQRFRYCESVCACVCVCVCVHVHCACWLSRACSWARWREHSLLSIWQLKTSHSKRPAQIVRSRNPRKLRGGVEGGGTKACLPGASIFFLMKLSVKRLVDRRPGYHAHLPALKNHQFGS